MKEKRMAEEKEALFDRLFLQYLTFFPISEVRKMLETAGGKAAFRKLPGAELYDLGTALSLTQCAQFDQVRNSSFLENELCRMEQLGVRYVPEDAPDFPGRLKDIPDPPFGLFVRGKLPDPKEKAVAIVGARNCSSYGRESAYFFGKELAKAGVNVVSGMALGIDGYAGRGALSGGGRSFAVLGGGVDLCYPAANVDLYNGLIESGGVLSERPISYRGRPADFPLRNRLVSGLSDLVVIVEAAEHSGSLITADLALLQGKDVFCLPGRIDDPLSYSCNALIKNGAFMLTCTEDLLQALGKAQAGETMKPKRVLLSKEEGALFSCMQRGHLTVDEMIAESGLPFSEIAGLLLKLEMKGAVARQGAGSYALKIKSYEKADENN